MKYLSGLLLWVLFALLCVERAVGSLDDFDTDIDDNDINGLGHYDELHSEMERYKDLPPDEAKEQMKKLVLRIDIDKDGMVTKEELAKWISDSLKKTDQKEAVYHLKENDENKDGFVTFKEFLHRSFGYTNEELEKLKTETSEESKNFLLSIQEEEDKFNMADLNKDGKLDLVEYAAFHHPSQYDHMKEFETRIHMHHFDKNKDGLISLREFAASDNESQMMAEKAHFNNFDKNKDGMLDIEEVKDWATPGYEATGREEADHLFEQSDLNRDGKLSEEEIISDYETWISSHATEYGDHLHKLKRDEL